jgi:iron complex transport system substrate-binding protein
MTEDSVIASEPDVIIIAHSATTADAVAARPRWVEVPAVVNDRIIAIDPDSALRPGPRIIDALEAVAKAVYPARFQ